MEALYGFWGYTIGIIGAIVAMLVDYSIRHSWEKYIRMEGTE